jgi:hydroxymethylglutaryl-CoA lyase
MRSLKVPMSDVVKIVECPRDAWQGLPVPIPTEIKAAYLRRLIRAGFRHIDAVSFVSPNEVPQMADSERVLEILKPPADVEIIAIVVNRKGAERAIQTGAVRVLGFPYSISPQFLARNQHQTQKDALRHLAEIHALAREAGLETVAYLSMAFGNPYNEPWSVKAVVDGCDELVQLGLQRISLADTVGLATAERIASTVGAVLSAYPRIEFGVHLHARRGEAASRVRAAFDAGCRSFDAALGGLGGCPFAQDEMLGNIPTEILIATLADSGANIPKLGNLDELVQASNEIAAGAEASK